MTDYCPRCHSPMDTISSEWVTARIQFNDGWKTYKLCGICSSDAIYDYFPEQYKEMIDDVIAGVVE